MDHLSLRPVYPKILTVLYLLCMAMVFFIPTFSQPLLAMGLSSLLLLLAVALSYTTYALKPGPKGELHFGIAFFHRFYPQKPISLQELSSLCHQQLPDRHWALLLITAGGEPLLLDKRPTLDALQKRRQQLEQQLQRLLTASASR